MEKRDASASQFQYHRNLCTRDLGHKANNRRCKVTRVSPLSRRTRSVAINHGHSAHGIQTIHEDCAARIGLAGSATLVDAKDLILAVLIVDCCGVVGAS